MRFSFLHSAAEFLIAAAQAVHAATPAELAEDLEAFATQFPQQEKCWTPGTRAAFEEKVTALRAHASELDEQHLVVGMMQAVALAKNAHTIARPGGNNPAFTKVPLRLHSFSDGLFVTAARPEQAALLGSRLTAVNGQSIDSVMEKIYTLFHGNESWRRYIGPNLVLNPGLLYGLDITSDPHKAEMTFALPDGNTLTQNLEAEPVQQTPPQHMEAWWDMTPTRQRNDGPWQYAFDPAKTPLPLYLRDPNHPFWMEYLQADKTLYVQYNTSIQEDSLPYKEYRESLLAAFEGRDIAKVVVDLRFNTGGNQTLMHGAFKKMMDLPALQTPGRLYIITGTATFSAGLACAAHLKQDGNAIIVGEPVGDYLDFWAELGEQLVLPHTRLLIFPQTRFHSYSKKQYPELKEFQYIDYNIDSLQPDFPAPMAYADYIAGRDPSMEAVLAHRN